MKSVDPFVYSFSPCLSVLEKWAVAMATLFQNMSPEEQTYLDGQRLEMIALKQTIAGLVEAGTAGGKGGGKGNGDERGRALLNRKDFG